MAPLLVDKRDQLFILNEMLDVSSRYFQGAGAEVEMVLSEAHKFAALELFPTNVEADRKGCVYDAHARTVRFPECLHAPYQKFREGGWLAICDSSEVGGSDFPMILGTAVSEVFYAGGFCLYGAAELSHASAKVIEKFGTEEQKKVYMTRLFSGEWTGAMCLTEPDAGSDVGAIRTSAKPNDDGTFAISGTKIFITAGEHDLTQNIVHMVLARVVGDEAGTKGLSLFIVPKHVVDGNGAILRRNAVFCTGIEHKMGLHGLATCTIAYGEGGTCVGYLLGERGKGIAEMFHMMNEQRLLVGLEGLSFSSAAFLHAVDYTKQRVQGASVYPGREKSTGSVAIINHPDVKRMLLTMKAQVEGGRALAYFTSYCIDRARDAEGVEQDVWQGLVELLIPVVKAYLTDKAWEITGIAMQCAGGYGYCSDYPFERLARDCKVTALFEGTNGIQCIDLMFRKLIGNRLINFRHLMRRIDETVENARQIDGLACYATSVREAKECLQAVAEQLEGWVEEGNKLYLYAKAGPFLEAMGDVILGWLHLWQLTIGYPRLRELVGANPIDDTHQVLSGTGAFYHGKVTSAQFYIATILKRTFGKFDELRSDPAPVLDVAAESFAG